MTVKDKTPIVNEENVFVRDYGTAEDAKAVIESNVKAAVERYMDTPGPEVAEPYLWWDLLAMGPIQIFSPDEPLAPHQIIKKDETAFVATILVLNPNPILQPGMSPQDLLSDFALPYEIRYQTGNVTNWALASSDLNAVHTGVLSPGQGIYVDILEFQASQVGMMEMNISARILGNQPEANPHFGGFARWTYDLDGESFWEAPTPGWHFELPVKFMIYP